MCDGLQNFGDFQHGGGQPAGSKQENKDTGSWQHLKELKAVANMEWRRVSPGYNDVYVSHTATFGNQVLSFIDVSGSFHLAGGSRGRTTEILTSWMNMFLVVALCS